MNIFKAYDVRGIYPSEIDEDLAERIGYATAHFIKGKTLAVGHDARTSAPSVARAVARGISKAGSNAVTIGLSTTPMLYFTVGYYAYSGGIMVTASHNPPEYIGFKICREEAFPIGEKTGLPEIQRQVLQNSLLPSEGSGLIVGKTILGDYRTHLLNSVKHKRPLTIAVDTANGSVGKFFQDIFGSLPIKVIPLFFEPDGRFPNHEPDPLKDENIRQLCDTVVQSRADLGVAFDGDGDRCMFIDEHGRRIKSDLITALLATEFLKAQPGGSIVYDLRSSRVVREEITRAGGVAIRERVGHAFIKETMRKHGAMFGGELSGHYYFKDHYYADSGMMAFAKVLDYLGNHLRPISELLDPLRRTCTSGEINFRVQDTARTRMEVEKAFAGGTMDRLDGLTVEFPDWWFNLRESNTEPLLRLNIEARSAELLEQRKKELFQVLGKPI